MLGFVSQLIGIFFAFLLLASQGKAAGVDARSPQFTDTSTAGETPLHFFSPTPSLPLTFTPISSVSAPTPSTSFSFNAIQNTDVCGSDVIYWNYSGDPSYTLMLTVGYAGLQDGANSTAALLTTDEGIVSEQYKWSPVAVPVGTYVIFAHILEVNMGFISNTFDVSDSSDHACLGSSSTSTTSAPTSTSASSTTSSSTSSVSSSGVTTLPVVGAAISGSSISSGGIAGVVIGAIAFVAGLVLVLFLLRRSRNRFTAGPARSSYFEKKPPKGAVAIASRGNSFSSTQAGAAQAVGADYGTTVNYYNGGRSQSANSSDEDLASLAHVASLAHAGEKTYAVGSTMLDKSVAMPLPVHRAPHAYRDSVGSAVSGTTAINSPGGYSNYARPSRHSSLIYASDPFRTQPSTPSPRPSGEYFDATGNQSQVPVALFSPPSHSPSPRSFGSPGVPRDISVASSSSPDLAYDTDAIVLSPVVVPPSVSRRPPPAPPTIGQLPKRARSARKPVPQYLPSAPGEALELVEPGTLRSVTSSAMGAGSSYYRSSIDQHSHASLAPSSSAGNDWSSAAVHSHSHSYSSASLTSSGSHLPQAGASASASAHSPNTLVGHMSFRGHENLPELNHKSSFGDRQVHYLIPDPPPEEMR